MLEPDDRQLLVDALKPPPEMSLDLAVGTTFTLDLYALLIAPVSFAFYGRRESGQGSDPLALLESVRRHADRITVFCQAGAIAVPRMMQPVLAWLEDVVVPVVPPPGHLFHPKVWLLRFIDDHGTSLHRLLVSSRNLTFDSSWDTIVRLDEDKDHGSSVDNAPLQTFVRSLAERPVGGRLDTARAEQLFDVAESVRSVKWELPDCATDASFWPLGVRGLSEPDLSADRTLVISPFLSAQFVGRASASRSDVLVSRAESIDEVGGDALAGFGDDTYILDVDPINLDEPDEDAVAGGEVPDQAPLSRDPSTVQLERPGSDLHGLHAKLFLIERGDRVHLFTGSANATDAGFGGNVEFLIELGASRAQWGIDPILNADGRQASLRDMLRQYRPLRHEPTEASEAERMTYRLDSLVRRLAALPFRLVVVPHGEEYRITATSDQPAPDFHEEIVVSVRLATIGEAADLRSEVRSAESIRADLGVVTLAGITSFVVVTASASVDGEDVRSSALINAQLVGAPSDRKERLLSAQLRSPEDLIRYLLFLLYDLKTDSQIEKVVAGMGLGGSSWTVSDGGVPLFETMLRALVHSPKSLDRVAELLDELAATDDGALIIPDDLSAVWGPIDAVRQELEP